MAADVVGYSRLMEADEAGTHARLKALRRDLIEPAIGRHKGRTVKLTGDGALVEFPSAVGAVLAAAEIQRAVAVRETDRPADDRIALRIGINLGDVIVEGDDIYGDGVNVAARPEGLAEPGGICVARTVYNHIKNKVDLAFEPMGEHRVKNIAERVTVFRVNLDAPGRALSRRPGWALRRWQAAGAAVVLLLALGAGVAWYGLSRPEATTEGAAVATAGDKPALPLPDKPSIAVLPFRNLSDDAEQEYFADAVTEDIITALARSGKLFVISSNSKFRIILHNRSPRSWAAIRAGSLRALLAALLVKTQTV